MLESGLITLRACLPKPATKVCFGPAARPHQSYSSASGWFVLCYLCLDLRDALALPAGWCSALELLPCACPPPAFSVLFPFSSRWPRNSKQHQPQLQVDNGSEPRGARIQITSCIASSRRTVTTLRLFIFLFFFLDFFGRPFLPLSPC